MPAEAADACPCIHVVLGKDAKADQKLHARNLCFSQTGNTNSHGQARHEGFVQSLSQIAADIQVKEKLKKAEVLSCDLETA